MEKSIRQNQLSFVFSKAFLSKVASDYDDAVSYIRDIILRSDLKGLPFKLCFADAYELIYGELIKSYRNEYVYKNAIADKIIKGRHKLSSSCYFSTEFRVGCSIADAVVANGTVTAYEIKTEFDSLDRLYTQLSDYSKVFERIYVVIPEVKLALWFKEIPNSVGVMVLTESYTLKTERIAESNMKNLDAGAIFSCLRRSEMINAIEKYFGEVPPVKPVSLKSACKELFMGLAIEQVHAVFLDSLKKRGLGATAIDMSKVGPSALTSVFLTANLTKKQSSILVDVFERQYITL